MDRAGTVDPPGREIASEGARGPVKNLALHLFDDFDAQQGQAVADRARGEVAQE